MDKKKIIQILSIFLVFLFTVQIFGFHELSDSTFVNSFNKDPLKEERDLKTAADKSFKYEWIENGGFNSEDNWYNSSSGDLTDTSSSIAEGMANLKINGTSGKTEIIANQTTYTLWNETKNPNFPVYPDNRGIDSSDGFFAEHEWNEGPEQTPSVNWIRNYKLPVNFSDYRITSASIQANFSADVDSNVDVDPKYGDTVEGDNTGSTFGAIYDFARFYIRISDPSNTSVYEISTNRTHKLGAPEFLTYINKEMNSISESNLIFFLTQVLSENYQNFSIIIGIDIFCEDNCHTDRDTWNRLSIHHLNLSFSYEKKIDKLSSISWNQDAEKISNNISIKAYNRYEINNARLNFSYKINKKWPEISSNSEIRIFLNDQLHTKTLNLLNDVNESIQKTSFNIHDLITDDVNLSIQLYLADDFELNDTILVSIDNVSLWIEYTVYFEDYETDFDLFLNGSNVSDTRNIIIPFKSDLNISVKYYDFSMGNPLENVSVELYKSQRLLFSLKEDEAFNQYTIILNKTEDLSLGVNNLVLKANKKNYEFQELSFSVSVRKIKTDFANLLINGEDKTTDPDITVPTGRNITISVKYEDEYGNFLNDALITLSGALSFELSENSTTKKYSTSINTRNLNFGANKFTLLAKKDDYEDATISPISINVRKLNTTVKITSETKVVNIRPGDDFNLEVLIFDEDNNQTVTNATITYNWEFGSGILKDISGNGTYTGKIDAIPSGTYIIKIDIVAREEYDIEDLEITVIANRPEGELLLFQLIAIIGLVSVIGLGSYFYAYQKYLKYPPTVRKVRKLRKKIRKDKKLKPMKVKDRDSLLQKSLKQETLQTLTREEESAFKDSKIKKKGKNSEEIKENETMRDLNEN